MPNENNESEFIKWLEKQNEQALNVAQRINLEKEAEKAEQIESMIIIGLVVILIVFFVLKLKPSITHQNWFKILTSDLKKTWTLFFCIISLIACIVFVPYAVRYKDKPTDEIVYASVLETQNHSFGNRHSIDYSMIAFREVLILVGCYAGYTLSTMLNRRR